MSDRGQQVFRSGGGLASWSVGHPIGVSMIMLALVVLGAFSYQRLPVNLLPDIIYPEIRIRIVDSGVPAPIMEERVTRPLEQWLATTEDVVDIRSRTGEGVTNLDLSFPYGKDIDIALRDASNRLDGVLRVLPDSIDRPTIFKRDPSQIPVAEFVISSNVRDAVELRSWVDFDFSKWFVNLPGVAAVEVAGGQEREIQVLPDWIRLAALGLTLRDLESALRKSNVDRSGGRLRAAGRQFSSRTVGRFTHVSELRELPIPLPDGSTLALGEVAEIVDGNRDEEVLVRLNGVPGVKVSMRKQPSANTVQAVEHLRNRLDWLEQQGFVPADVTVQIVSDQSRYVRAALDNARLAGLGGAALAMLVVFLFLGDIRRTLIIGTAIPIAFAVTLLAMNLGGLTLNIMTLGGLAVGMGMLVDSTIVMLENVYRHQRRGERGAQAGMRAAAQVNSAIVASTTTNLAAIVPFLFIGGLVGLLFRELIYTISAAIFASMLVALTLVPALASRVPVTRQPGATRRLVDAGLETLEGVYSRLLEKILSRWWAQLTVIAVFVVALFASVPPWLEGDQVFLPEMDDGQVFARVITDPGTPLEETDAGVRRIENLLLAQPEVQDVFVVSGGWIFGRGQRVVSHVASLYVQLTPPEQRAVDSATWVESMREALRQERLVGFRINMHVRGLRGLRVSSGDDQVSLRLQGPDLETLRTLGSVIEERLEGIEGLRNVSHSGEEVRQELAVNIDRRRAAELGLSAEEIGAVLRTALEGHKVSDFIDGPRQYDIRLRLPHSQIDSLEELRDLLLFAEKDGQPAVHLRNIADVELIGAPVSILRERQERMVEILASPDTDTPLSEIGAKVQQLVREIQLPQGYTLDDVGAFEGLKEGRRASQLLLGLALFLVFVVMAVQYESLRNPFVILLGVPFAAVGVALGLPPSGLDLSMPVWLGLIMLAGIVVNNAIVLVEYIEILRKQGMHLPTAVAEAAHMRMRPILMTTLTTVVGLLPLGLGLASGTEMLQPLAATIMFGLTFSLLVSFFLIPVLYYWLNRLQATTPACVS